MFNIDKRILNFLVIIVLTALTFWWTFFIFHQPIEWQIVAGVIIVRIFASLLIFKDYSLSWSKATQRTFLLKSIVYIAAFVVYFPIFYGKVRFSLLASELFLYLFSINFLMYVYYYLINKNTTTKTKSAVIYGAGKAGIKLEEEFVNSEYRVKYFADDDPILQKRSIDGIRILSKEALKNTISKNGKLDL
ncbi:MAG: polysaccharide biosynthesis protein, partial [Sulfurimonas sp.]|nr:polysaccharide biosynthesis protein [Sulfurimonas sp.]